MGVQEGSGVRGDGGSRRQWCEWGWGFKKAVV